MKSLSRLASYSEAVLGLFGAGLFWLLDAAFEKYLIGSSLSFTEILINPNAHELHMRLLATFLIVVLVILATFLLRRKEDAQARMEHSQFLLREMTIELGQKNEKLQAEIARRKDTEQRLVLLAETDQLTGIHNRRKFDEQLQLELRQEARYQRGLCLAILDIDRFKDINDRHGHAAGDRVLHELARLIEDTRREADSFFRIGGEEFSLITFANDNASLATACEKIRATVSQHCFTKVDHLTVSIGATHYQPGDDYDSLFRRADAALYAAKAAGRDQVVID